MDNEWIMDNYIYIMDNEEYWNKIVKKILPKSIDINNVLNITKVPQTLFVQIYNNEIYLLNPLVEERHTFIINQLKDCLKKYKIDNTIFAYSTVDKYHDSNDYIFTHSLVDNNISNHILAPCFTFDSYPEKKETNFVKYETTYSSLLANSEYFINCLTNWKQKNNNLVFVGSLTDNNYRIHNTNFSSNCIVTPIVKNLSAASENFFISREELIKYKYLLHLNGNEGAYASRLKYLLLTNSLIFYITEYENDVNIIHREFWMCGDDFDVLIIFCKNVKDCENKIKYYHKNQDITYKLCKNLNLFCKKRLSKDSILLYWSILLNNYTTRIIDKSFFDRVIFKYKV